MASSKTLSSVKPKELGDLYRATLEEGCTVQISARTHVVVVLPDGQEFHGPLTSGNRRSVLNTRTRLRRLGLSLPSRKQQPKKKEQP